MRNLMCKCDKCQSLFDEDQLAVDYVSGGYHGEPFYKCPYCGYDEWDYVAECCRCGEYISVDGEIYGTLGSMVCRKCIDKEMDAETVIAYGDYSVTEATLNGLFTFVYSEDEINEILKKEFMRMREDKRNQFLKDYVESDLPEFAEWLES